MAELPEFVADVVAAKAALEILMTADEAVIERAVMSLGFNHQEALYKIASAIREGLSLGDYR